MSHTTGYKFSGNTQIEQGMDRQQILEKLKTQKTACKPGKCYLYSNIIFSLIEETLNTKKLSLNQAIQKLKVVLNTDGIQIIPLKPCSEVAYPHIADKSKKGHALKMMPFPPYYPKATPASAGVFASLDGMIELFKLSFGYRSAVISQKTLDQFFTPLIANHDIEKWGIRWPCSIEKIASYYGLGWRILKAHPYPDKDLIFHSGYISGAVSFIGFMPSEEIGIILLINQNPGIALKKGIEFWGEFLQ